MVIYGIPHGSRPASKTPGEKEREKALNHIAEALHQVNAAIRRAVDAGLSVEMVRTARYHDGKGHWGDEMTPAIRDSGPRP